MAIAVFAKMLETFQHSCTFCSQKQEICEELSEKIGYLFLLSTVAS